MKENMQAWGIVPGIYCHFFVITSLFKFIIP